MPSHEGRSVLPGKYDLTCASSGPPRSTTQTTSRSVKLFLHSSRQSVVGHAHCPGMSFPLIIAPSHGASRPHLIHASLGPPESITQMASQTVQPFLHSSYQKVPILYNGRPFPPKLPLPIGGSGPQSNTWFLPWARPGPQPKRHLDRFSHVCEAH